MIGRAGFAGQCGGSGAGVASGAAAMAGGLAGVAPLRSSAAHPARADRFSDHHELVGGDRLAQVQCRRVPLRGLRAGDDCRPLDCARSQSMCPYTESASISSRSASGLVGARPIASSRCNGSSSSALMWALRSAAAPTTHRLCTFFVFKGIPGILNRSLEARNMPPSWSLASSLPLQATCGPITEATLIRGALSA